MLVFFQYYVLLLLFYPKQLKFINQTVKYFFLKFDKNLLIKAAATPKLTAKIIENNPYKTGTSTESLLINLDNGFKS